MNGAAVLVANRGEIARRVLATARRLGHPTVAVFSDADRGAPHVADADRAYYIGSAPAADSYLRGDRILEAARHAGCAFVHPGYGFLSENARFAQACQDAGVIFVGPPVAAIESMGDKIRSKAIMEGAKVPLVPGYHGDGQDLDALLEEAKNVGFPVLVKAAMGGGGKGMKVAWGPEDFREAAESAKREALKAFGDDRVLLERYVLRPRHIEVQVFADHQGNVVHLYERDCSVQRRHQKVIEEAPAPNISDEFRQDICASAVAAAKAVGYVNAGTVEFLVDADTDEYYFMEMNTRLQVEHPVTEAITRQDLVEWQLRVAGGEALPLAQEDIPFQGHAVEARIYAEAPEKGFLPAVGTVRRWRPSCDGAFHHEHEVRFDSSIAEGDAVQDHYDPMLGKMIAYGADRNDAINKLADALRDTQAAGLPTNFEYCSRIITHPVFEAGRLDTTFIEEHGDELLAEEGSWRDRADGIALAAVLEGIPEEKALEMELGLQTGPWDTLDGFRNWGRLKTKRALRFGKAEERLEVEIERVDSERDFVVSITGEEGGEGGEPGPDGRPEPATVLVQDLKVAEDAVSAVVQGKTVEAHACAFAAKDGDRMHLWLKYGVDSVGFEHRLRFERRDWAGEAAGPAASGTVRSPMPGRVVKVNVAEAEEVKEGAVIAVIEAMKMEHAVVAPKDGVVAKLGVTLEGQVEEGSTIAVIG